MTRPQPCGKVTPRELLEEEEAALLEECEVVGVVVDRWLSAACPLAHQPLSPPLWRLSAVDL